MSSRGYTQDSWLFGFRWRPEKEQQQECGSECGQRWRNKDLLPIHSRVGFENISQLRPKKIANERSEAKNQEVKQTLCSSADVLGKKLVHENINRGEEK